MKSFFNTAILATLIGFTGNIAIAQSPVESSPTVAWRVKDLNQPESVIADSAGHYLYVSNINGQPMELNGKGYISRLNLAGEIIDKQWVTGLDAPKGMAISNHHLYIADMQTLHVVDLSNARIVKRYQAPKAKMLNDVTVSNEGVIYVSDFLGGAIYKLDNGEFEPWLKHSDLPYPNGILWHDGSLFVANWGEGLNNDFSTEVPGTLYRLNTKDKALTPVSSGFRLGNLDGIVAMEDSLYVSDWISGDLYQLGHNERRKTLSVNSGLADIGASNDKILYAPMMMDNEVVAWKIQH